MPAPRKTRLAEPTRPRQPHAGESFDPVGLHRGGGGPGVGVFVMIGAGMLGFAYAFNLGGLQGIVDSVLKGFDAAARSHTGDVVVLAPKALPYVGYAVLGVAVLVVLLILGRLAETLASSLKPKKRAKPPNAVKVGEAAKAEEPQAPRSAQEFVRPRRLTVREDDLLPKPNLSASKPPNTE